MRSYDFGEVKISEDEIEQRAIKLYRKNHNEQPSTAMTEVFKHKKELFVTLANINGPLETLRVAAIANKIFFQELDDDELAEISAARVSC
jgi:hypothetical protein